MKYLIITLMVLVGHGLSAQMTTSGVYISQGATLYAGGGLIATQSYDDSLIVEGILTVEDSLVVSSINKVRISGLLALTGNDTLLVNVEGLRVDSLEIAASENKVSLLGTLAVNYKLLFTSGNIYLGGQELALGPDAAIEYDGSYATTVPIVANDGGNIVLEGLSDSVYVPIGYDSQYLNAITLKNSGAIDTFSVSVMENVLEDGLSGNTITDDVAQITWMIQDSANAAYNLSAWLYWNAAQEGTGFDNSQAGIASFQNNDWDLNVSNTGNASSRSIGIDNITDVDNRLFAVADASSQLINAFNLSVKIFLEGAYNNTTGEMSTNLNSILPDSASHARAYGSSPYNYAGYENFEQTGVPNSNVVDWVLVELRHATTAADAVDSTTILSLAGLLLSDGTIVTTDGSTILNTGELNITDNLFLVVRHRNHADVMSAVALISVDGVFIYDFTTALTQAYGSNSMNMLSSGVYGFWPGDVNGDAEVKYTGSDNDATEIFNAVNGNSSVINTLSGYYWYDVNMDGTVKYTGSDNDATVIFNTIDGNTSVINTQTSNLP